MKRKLILIFPLLAIFIFACTEEVIECKKRHVDSITIIELPSGFDLIGDPDLRCDLAPSNSNYWSYQSHTVDNVSGLPVTISFVSDDILFSKEQWSMRLVDEDLIGEETIYSAEFDPYDANDGVIQFFKDGLEVLNINYSESE
jgi:hypothetical protein